MSALYPLAAAWEVRPLGDLCSGGDASIQTGPFGSQLHASDYVKAGVPCVMPQDIRNGRVSTESIARISEEDHTRLKRFHLRKGDIVYPRRGDISKRALIEEREAGWLCGTGCLRIRPNISVADPKFLAYYLSHPDVCAWIEGNAVGATMPHLNTALAGSVPVVCPPIDEQREIAATLGALDDKIEVNRRMAATLEEMARALYRSWFIDFDPVHAKAEGRAPAHMDPATAALFPARFTDDGMPEGWEMATIGEVSEIVGGSTPPTKTPAYWEGGTHAWATPRDLAGLSDAFLIETSRAVTDQGLAKIGSGLSPAGSMLLSSRAPIGYRSIARVPVAVNQGFIVIRETTRITGIEAYLWCEVTMDTILNNANGSTFQEISKKNFRPIPYLVANDAVRRAFDHQVRPMFDRMALLCEENLTLAAMRDALLPKLMSGELRVREAEAQIAEVV